MGSSNNNKRSHEYTTFDNNLDTASVNIAQLLATPAGRISLEIVPIEVVQLWIDIKDLRRECLVVPPNKIDCYENVTS